MIVYGGWEGHDPEGLRDVFTGILNQECFQVTASGKLETYLEDLTQYDLLIPIWTMGELSGEAEANVSETVASGVGMAGCHGGMCDAFRGSTLWQFITGSQWVAHPGGEVPYMVNIKNPRILRLWPDLMISLW